MKGSASVPSPAEVKERESSPDWRFWSLFLHSGEWAGGKGGNNRACHGGGVGCRQIFMSSDGEKEDWLKVICILLEELKRKAFLKEKTHHPTSSLSFGENSPRLKIVRRGGPETTQAVRAEQSPDI